MGHHQRHYESANRRSGPHPTQSDRSAVQDLIGENRQQRRRAPEQHREQIQRNRCQDHLFAEHESDSSHQTFPGACLSLISQLRAAADRKNENEKGKGAERIQHIDKRKPEIRYEQSADGRADN